MKKLKSQLTFEKLSAQRKIIFSENYFNLIYLTQSPVSRCFIGFRCNRFDQDLFRF